MFFLPLVLQGVGSEEEGDNNLLSQHDSPVCRMIAPGNGFIRGAEEGITVCILG